ncbi:MAG: tetratricopeptide repeat protein [Betaproteobacteria bacterium]|nr:tetratricopeptide repeat protein [Betaproteobacteria bacterium]
MVRILPRPVAHPTANAKPMELRLVAIETDSSTPTTKAADGRAAVESAAIEPPPAPADRFLAKATCEYEAGQVEQPLWMHAATQAGGDDVAVLAGYLRARATALRLAERRARDSSSGRRSRRAPPVEADAGASVTDACAASLDGGRQQARRSARLRRWWPAAAALAIAGVVGWTFIARGADDTGARTAGASMTTPAAGTAARAPAGVGQPASAPAAAPTDAAAQRAERESKVQELIAAGNWNVLVLHAAEWTRKEPANAEAWMHLSVGYANLRQNEDALAAAERATQLAPAERELWKNLGRAGLAAGRPEAALHAYQQAVARDEHDAASLTLVGKLSAELALLPQAKLAYDRALTVSPGDPDARCGQAQVAQKQGRGKEAEAIVRDLRRGGSECSLADSPLPATAMAVPAPAAKSLPQSVR